MENNSECEDLVEDVFKEAENALSTTIPNNIKKLLTINGYDDKKALSFVDEKSLDTIEVFAIEVLPNLIDSDEYASYYGIFKNNIKKFQILSGFRKRILMVAEFYKTKFSKKNSEFILKRKILNTHDASLKKKFTSIDLIPNTIASELVAENNVIDSVIDIENERAFVEKSIRKWLRNQQEIDIKSLCNNNLNISVRVNEKINNDTEDMYYTCNYICIINCVVCKSEQTVRKVADKSHVKGRWVFSNFYRHIISHTTDCKKQKLKPPIRKVTDYFNSTETTSNHSSHHVVENSSLNQQLSINNDSTEQFNIDLASSNTAIEELDFHESSIMNQGTHNRLPEQSLISKLPCNSKWKNSVYSRKERETRRRHKSLVSEKILHGLDQPLISNFYPILDKVSKLLKENENLKQMLLDNINNHNNYTGIKVSKQIENMPILLKHLFKSSTANSDRKSNANIYDDTIKKFSLYLFFVGGRHLYQTLCNNMPNSIPSISSLFRYFGKTQKISEGCFRFMELRKFLDDRDLPLYVWLSEDGTRITGRIEYDNEDNKLVGFVLPLKNGCPKMDTFVVTSVKSVLDAFKTATKSKYAYCIMAQPSVPSSPSFCVSIFGTDNCFSFEDVINRWDKMIEMANNQNIHILGFSSDGDPRLLKAMQYCCMTRSPEASSNCWFKLGSSDGYNSQSRKQQIYVQDTTHIGTKLRTRMLKPAIVLPLGKYNASVAHLYFLVDTFSKDKHLLNKSDLNSVDKMNYRAAEKMCSNEVISLLKSIPDTEGTTAYLMVMQFVISAFNDHSLSIPDRVYKLWFAVFFLRQWKIWIKNNNFYNCTANFISLNSYYCIELNAHALIQLINTPDLIPELFVPWLYSSQPCEQLFRATRSLTSTFNTVVNFSVKELLNRVKRIEILNTISNELSQPDNTKGKDSFRFPRGMKQSLVPSNYLSNINIDNFNANNLDIIINDALKDCKIMLVTLGIMTEEDIIHFDEPIFNLNIGKTSGKTLDKTVVNTFYDNHLSDDSEEDSNENVAESKNNSSNNNTDFDLDEDDRALDLCNLASIDNFGEYLNVKNFEKQFHEKTCGDFDNSTFIQIKIKNKSMVIKKSTLCWLLDNEKDLVSTDRLRRFIPVASKNDIELITSKKITINDRVHIGDWAVFKVNNTIYDKILDKIEDKINNKNLNGIIIGRILAFGYVNKRSKAFNRQYILMKEDNLDEVGCHCSWYILNELGIFCSFEKNDNVYQCMSTYIFSIPSPSIRTIEHEKLVFSLNTKLYKDLEHQVNTKQSLFNNNRDNNSILSNSDDTDESTNDLEKYNNLLCYNINNESEDEVHDEPQNIGIEEIKYEQVIWDSIKDGVYLLVDFIGGVRKKTHYKHVCVVESVDQVNRDIVVMGLKKNDSFGIEFCINEKDVSTINTEMIIAILPIPKFMIKNKKVVYQFPGYVSVNENH